MFIVSSDITVKRILLPVTVRAMWEFESRNWTTEIGFNHETFQFPNDRYAYMILLAVFDYRSARYVRKVFLLTFYKFSSLLIVLKHIE